jgi:hypothetical protein
LCASAREPRSIDSCGLQKGIEGLEPLDIAKLHELRGLGGKFDGGHRLLLATGTRTIQVLDREVENVSRRTLCRSYTIY